MANINNNEVKNSQYEPVYLSKQHDWKNGINYTSGEEIESRKKTVLQLGYQFTKNLESIKADNIDILLLRQVIITWIYQTTFYDAELHNFDKKVGIDARALIAENMTDG